MHHFRGSDCRIASIQAASAERSFATRSGVANGLCGLAARHSRRIAAGLSQFLIRGGGWAKGLQENLVLDKFREQLCRIVISHLRIAEEAIRCMLVHQAQLSWLSHA